MTDSKPDTGGHYIQKCLNGRLVTVEVSFFFYMFSVMLSTPASMEYIYWTVCMERLDDDELLCALIDSEPELKPFQDEIQKTSSQWFELLGIALTLPGFLTSLVLGSWCDKFSWKLPLLLPPVGQFLMYSIMFCVSFQRVSIWVLIASAAFGSLFGGFYSVIMGTFGYASQITTDENRQMRMGILEGVNSAASLCGFFISGYAVRSSYSVAFLLIASGGFVSSLYVVLFIKELHTWEDILARKGRQSWFRFLFGLDHFVDSCRVAFRPRGEAKRKHVLLATFGFNITVFCFSGYVNVLQLFLFSQPLSFTPVEVGVYQAIGYGLSGFGAIFVLYLLREKVGVSDGVVGMLGVTFRMCIFTLTSFHMKWSVYAALPFFIFNGYACIGLRTIIARSVEPNEHGQIFAFVGVVEGIFTMLSSIICNAIYADTLAYFPGYTYVWLFFVLLIALLFTFLIDLDYRWSRAHKLKEVEVGTCN